MKPVHKADLSAPAPDPASDPAPGPTPAPVPADEGGAPAIAGRRARAISPGLLSGLVGYHLRRAQVTVFQNFAETMGRIEITPGQFGVLTLIAANPGLSQADLGAAMGIDRSTVVAVIDKLEGRGLVVRAKSPTDRRSHALQLSADGEALRAEAERRVRAHEDRIARALGEDERALLMDLLARIADPHDGDPVDADTA